ncbi:hypothetical protein C1645_839230 [Glomus cerebriforme]|uniref:Uncharacterized protein n=1 Tax=Glomus cerebriforme TaxID=658196 RepID=A0A397S140_9GLOM|nr:hypothetical protein C1645_839230 [Glomus cerebriforme]
MCDTKKERKKKSIEENFILIEYNEVSLLKDNNEISKAKQSENEHSGNNKFLEDDDNDDFEEKLEYDEMFLEQLINQDSELLNAEDNEIEDENIDYEQEPQELENESELHENEIYIIDETSLSPCVIVDIINEKLQTCGMNSKKNILQLVGTWQIDTDSATKFLNEKINLSLWNELPPTFLECL